MPQCLSLFAASQQKRGPRGHPGLHARQLYLILGQAGACVPADDRRQCAGTRVGLLRPVERLGPAGGLPGPYITGALSHVYF
eukprot:1161244-Pelagomonas_calceolata.AAC.5